MQNTNLTRSERRKKKLFVNIIPKFKMCVPYLLYEFTHKSNVSCPHIGAIKYAHVNDRVFRELTFENLL